MPETGLTLNPGAGGSDLDAWQDPNTSRLVQSVRQRDDRGGTLFAASSGLITLTATASLRVWGIFNPDASGKVLYIHRIFVSTHATAAASTIALLLQRTTDVTTTGTTITATRPISSPNASIANLRSLPTAGTVTGGNLGAILLPTTAGATIGQYVYDDAGMMGRDIAVAASVGLLLVASGTPNTNHRVQVDCVWEEV